MCRGILCCCLADHASRLLRYTGDRWLQCARERRRPLLLRLRCISMLRPVGEALPLPPLHAPSVAAAAAPRARRVHLGKQRYEMLEKKKNSKNMTCGAHCQRE
jgi:hypothetical protein